MLVVPCLNILMRYNRGPCLWEPLCHGVRVSLLRSTQGTKTNLGRPLGATRSRCAACNTSRAPSRHGWARGQVEALRRVRYIPLYLPGRRDQADYSDH
jgi:hypothetical protein